VSLAAQAEAAAFLLLLAQTAVLPGSHDGVAFNAASCSFPLAVLVRELSAAQAEPRFQVVDVLAGN
jgi:hypothetical protein